MAASNQSIVPRESYHSYAALSTNQLDRRWSTHSTSDCLVTVAWANEISAGVMAPMQVMKTGPVSPQDRFDDNLLLQISKRKNWKGLLRSDSFRRSATKFPSCTKANGSELFEIAPSLGQRPVKAEMKAG